MGTYQGPMPYRNPQGICLTLLGLVSCFGLHAQAVETFAAQAFPTATQEIRPTFNNLFLRASSSPGLVPSDTPFGLCPATVDAAAHVHAHYSARENSPASKAYRSPNQFVVPTRTAVPAPPTEPAMPLPDHAYQPVR